MKKHTLLLACAMRILLNLIALPPKGEARRYVANDFLNLIALLRGGLLREDKKENSRQPLKKKSHHFYKIKERIKTPWIKMYSINCSSKS